MYGSLYMLTILYNRDDFIFEQNPSIMVIRYSVRGSFIRGIFRTLSNIKDGAFFAKIVNDVKPLTIFAKKLNHGCLTRF